MGQTTSKAQATEILQPVTEDAQASGGEKKHPKAGQIIWKIIQYAILVITSIITLLPLVVALFGSLKTSSEFNSTNVLALPKNFFNFSNYVTAFIDGNMLTGFLNTCIILVFSLVATILTGTMTAYILNRFKFPGRRLVNNLFLLASLIPSITMQMSVFQIISGMGLFNNRLSVSCYMPEQILFPSIFSCSFWRIYRHPWMNRQSWMVPLTSRSTQRSSCRC